MSAYTGRLAFDPETGFHLDPEGQKVVSDDGGLSWRYAGTEDSSHQARYERRILVVDPTANAPEPEPHHYEVLADDPHAEGILLVPDAEAPTSTGHTEAYRG